MNTIKSNYDKLSREDVYSLLLFALYKVKDLPEYSTLGELAYILDKQSLLNFLDFYGGTTITIPTLNELKTLVSALILYEGVNLEHKSIRQVIKEMNYKEYQIDEIKKVYYQLCEELSKYDFAKR